MGIFTERLGQLGLSGAAWDVEFVEKCVIRNVR